MGFTFASVLVGVVLLAFISFEPADAHNEQVRPMEKQV